MQRLVTSEIAQALLAIIKDALRPGAISLSRVRDFPNLLRRPALEIYGYQYPPLLAFLWGLTPIVTEVTRKDLLPTYDYFRIYRKDDVCRVHFDRPSCEHSLSLTLGYSDDETWPLDIGQVRHPQPNASVAENFADEPFSSIAMSVGDAVLYRGTNHRHGRVIPNPNGWSAHLFLHWVERQGAYADHAFDQHMSAGKVNLHFT